MTSHDELSYYLSQGLAIRVDGITISDANERVCQRSGRRDLRHRISENQRIICKEYSRAGRLISQLIIYLLDSFQCHLRYIEQLFSDSYYPEVTLIPQD